MSLGLLLLVVVACTGAPPAPGPRPDGTPSPAAEGRPPVRIAVVASLTGPTAELDLAYLDGMRLALRTVNGAGGIRGRPLRLEVVDDGGVPSTAREGLGAAVEESPAVVVVGEGEAVTALRPEIEQRGTPVMLVGADLYSARELFRQVFQSAPPVAWQAAALARYLVTDRGARRILVVTGGDRAAADAVSAALADEGRPPFAVRDVGAGAVTGGVLRAARRADAVVVAAGPETGAAVAEALRRLPDPPRLALTGQGLERSFAEASEPAPGTVAVGAYAWAGWADPIPRVARFRAAFERRFGRLPGGFEQEGYEAVRTLAFGLHRSRGRGGDALVGALEGFPGGHFASVPIDLGPDDHLLADRHLLGAFAVAGPGEEVEPFAPGWAPWRPVMRTFTLLLGERTSILDRDKRVFFPGWRRREPAPFYWRSRYGIVTRAEEDPLH
ncbi:MAG: ABC transporter substrate-binding protein [Actinomycetota bacterium]